MSKPPLSRRAWSQACTPLSMGWSIGWVVSVWSLTLGLAPVQAQSLSASPQVTTAGLATTAAPRGSTAPIDTIVVRPAGWGAALNRWKAYRHQQGHQIVELDSSQDSAAIRQAIIAIAAAQATPPRFVMLAGDVTANGQTTVPTFYHDSTAMRQFGGDPQIASDNSFGDLDGDGFPELAIGRIPADSPDQLKQTLARVIAFESQPDFSLWRRDVHVVAGVGGFGPVADSVIEMTTRRFLTDRIPGWSEISMTQANISSHYCPDPWRFSEACIERMNQGGMFWVYIGHGHVKTLDYVRAGEEWLPILTHEHVPAVQAGQRPPIAVFLACYTGAFDAVEDSLAEQLVLSRNGPIAALAASRVSGPYGLAMLSDGLLAGCFDQQIPTLGEVVLRAKQRLLITTQNDAPAARQAQLQLISAIAAAMSPNGYDLAAERREHVWEMNLLGDPLLHIAHPGDLTMRVAEQARPGERLFIGGHSDIPGKLTIELVRRRDQSRKDLDQLAVGLDSSQGREAYQQRYQAANQRVIAQREVQLKGTGEFQVELLIPDDVPRGKYAIRAFQEGVAAWRVGYQEIDLRPEPPPP